jgi:hypothetical protein
MVNKHHAPGTRLRRWGVLVVFLVLLTGLLTGWPPVLGIHNRNTSAAKAASDPVIAAAGDIACDPLDTGFNGGNGTATYCRQLYTSNLLVNAGLSAVLALGDNQYECGGYQAFLQSYDLSWGRVKSITHPVVGNHEYLSSGGTNCTNGDAAGYFQYFGAAAGSPTQGYYSFNIGAWHLIALNSNCSNVGGCAATSPQGKWLVADLAAHPNMCTLAFWHIPLFSSGGFTAQNSQYFWQALYNAHADLILNGHAHVYERFAPQTPQGVADPAQGIREFIVGTGGANHTSINTVAANSEVRDSTSYGVLKLTLHAASYDWQFVPAAGGSFTDSGTTNCHEVAADTTPPTAPTNLKATSVTTSKVSLSWTASTDNVGVAGYQIFRNGAQIGTSSSTTYADSTVQPQTNYSYFVKAVDGAGNVSASSNTINVTTPANPTAIPTSTPLPTATPRPAATPTPTATPNPTRVPNPPSPAPFSIFLPLIDR